MPLLTDKTAFAANPATAVQKLGDLPEWDLSDLYPSIESDEISNDIEACEKRAKDFQESYRGKLSKIAETAPETLLAAITTFEDLQDKLGRIASFAGLSYASNTTDPARAKFYGDTNEKLTAISSNLLFFGLSA